MPHFDAPKELSRLASRSASADPVSNPDMMRVLMGLANHLPGMVAYWDASLICIFANNAYVEWFGKTAEEMLGISIRELLGEALYARNEIYIRGAMAGERQAFERTLTKPSGEVGHTWAQYIPDIAATGEVRGMYVLVTDITELRNTARALQETNIELEAARKRAEQAAEAKSSFLASMSHEIRTPLTSIIGYAELLRDAPGASEDVPRFGEQIAAAGTGLMSLVNDILDHTRLEAREIKLEPLPCDVVAVTREIADLLSIQAAAKSLDITIETSGEVPSDLMLDEMRLRQIIQNLAGNAIKFTDEGSVTIHIEYRTGELRMAVSDTGIGISAAGQEKLFHRFSQVDRQPGTVRNGTGLGLMICKQLAELMGGRIDVESLLGKGSTFRLAVPACRCDYAADFAPRTVQRDHVQGSLLVVDDHGPTREFLARMLEADGHRVTMAANGADALARLGQESFDLVLVDVHMPAMKGTDLARRIRASIGPARDKPIIAMTADDGALNACLEAEMDDFIKKPLKPGDLRGVIRRWLR